MTDQPNLQDMLDKFDPFNISHNDFVRMKPEAIDAIYAAGLSAIGPDEKIKPWLGDAGGIRNIQRAEQRKAWQRACYGDEK